MPQVELDPVCVKGPLDYMDSVSITCYSKCSGSIGWFRIDVNSGSSNKIAEGDKVVVKRYGVYVNATLNLKNVTRLNDSAKYLCSKFNRYNVTRNSTVEIFVKGRHLQFYFNF